MQNAIMQPERMKNRKKPLPSMQALLSAAHEFFICHEDGTLEYQKDPRHPECTTSKVIGKQVGGDDGHGYLMCMLMGHKFKVHQIVWMMHYGSLPSFPIDHIDRDRRNNRIGNLREASDLENLQNTSSSLNEHAGASKVSRRTGYAARVQVRGKKHFLGYFPTKDLAHAAYLEGKRRLCGDFSPV